jgi:hypothetical protein
LKKQVQKSEIHRIKIDVFSAAFYRSTAAGDFSGYLKTRNASSLNCGIVNSLIFAPSAADALEAALLPIVTA